MGNNIVEHTLNKVVFLDRDGTLNEEVNYLHKPEDMKLLPGVPQALKKLKDAGYKLIVVTNQAGVARGYYTEEDVKNRFGALYNAFQYGTPPHAGAAPGVDRMVMLIADSTNIREVIAFPKNQNAICPMTNAPGVADNDQLDELNIKLDVHDAE